jgi:hypothetical protein
MVQYLGRLDGIPRVHSPDGDNRQQAGATINTLREQRTRNVVNCVDIAGAVLRHRARLQAATGGNAGCMMCDVCTLPTAPFCKNGGQCVRTTARRRASVTVRTVSRSHKEVGKDSRRASMRRARGAIHPAAP